MSIEFGSWGKEGGSSPVELEVVVAAEEEEEEPADADALKGLRLGVRAAGCSS